MPNKNEGNINPYSAKVIQLGFNISVSGDPDTDFQVVLDDNGRSCCNESQIQPSGLLMFLCGIFQYSIIFFKYKMYNLCLQINLFGGICGKKLYTFTLHLKYIQLCKFYYNNFDKFLK